MIDKRRSDAETLSPPRRRIRRDSRQELSSPPFLRDTRDDRVKSIDGGGDYENDLYIRKLSDYTKSLQRRESAASAKFRWDNLLAWESANVASPVTPSGHDAPESHRFEMHSISPGNFAPTSGDKSFSPQPRGRNSSFCRTTEDKNVQLPESDIRGLGREGFACGGSSKEVSPIPVYSSGIGSKMALNEFGCRRETFDNHGLNRNSSFHNAGENFRFAGENTEGIASRDSHFGWNPKKENPIPVSSSGFSGEGFHRSTEEAAGFAYRGSENEKKFVPYASSHSLDKKETFVGGENPGVHINLNLDKNVRFTEPSSGGYAREYAPFGQSCEEEKPIPASSWGTSRRVLHNYTEEASGFASVDGRSENNIYVHPNPLLRDKQEVLHGESPQVQGACNSKRACRSYEGNNHLAAECLLQTENDSAGLRPSNRIIDLRKIRQSRLSKLTEDLDASKSFAQDRYLGFNHADDYLRGLPEEQSTYGRSLDAEHSVPLSASRDRGNLEMFGSDEYRQSQFKTGFIPEMTLNDLTSYGQAGQSPVEEHAEFPNMERRAYLDEDSSRQQEDYSLQCCLLCQRENNLHSSEVCSHQILMQEELPNQNIYEKTNQRKRIIDLRMIRESKQSKMARNFDASGPFNDIKYQDQQLADEDMKQLMRSRNIDGNQIQDEWPHEVPSLTILNSGYWSSPPDVPAYVQQNMKKSLKKSLGLAQNGYGPKPSIWTKSHVHKTCLKPNPIDFQESVDAQRLKSRKAETVCSETGPQEDSPEFKQRVNRKFLKIFKILNENSAQRRKYTEKGSMGSLRCCVCGSQSKEFVDTKSLAMHAFDSRKVGIRAEHLGLHKALCLLMGWRSVSVSTLHWVPNTLPKAEALALKDEIIIWPPIIVIHNSSISNKNSAERIIVNIEELKTSLRDMGYDGITVCRGRPANQSIMIAMFDKCLTGLEEAEKLHRYFSENKRGRNNFQEVVSSCSTSKSSNGELPLLQVDKVKSILYGYLGTAFDLDKLDYETKKHCQVKSKNEIKAENQRSPS